MRLRIQFEKLGPARFSSHRDVMRVFQRCFAAAGIPVSYSEGYHPHMKMSFAPPLKTGWEGFEEYLDLHVDGPPGEIRDTCNAHLPEGIRIKHVVALAERAPKIASDVAAAVISVRVGGDVDTEALERGIRERAGAEPDGAPRVVDLTVENGDGHVDVVYTTTMASGKIIGPADLFANDAGDMPLRCARRSQFVERGGEFVSPISKGVLLNQS